jgi:predicted dehydrogenase
MRAIARGAQRRPPSAPLRGIAIEKPLARELEVGRGARAYDSAEELAADAGVDAIWVCARNDTRVSAMRAIARGAQRRPPSAPLRGIAIEKPLARTLEEALEVAEIAKEIGAATGYLEDMVFAPALTRGKEVLWRRGAASSGRPYLARAAEEHAGPHSRWFWEPAIAGGGALLDMMCHSIEAARWLLTAPGAPRSSLIVEDVSATIANLKWTQPKHAAELAARHPGLDWARHPSEDFARATVTWRTTEGQLLLTETTSSWCYVGAGLRHTFALLGPEYSLDVDMADTGVRVFFSRKVSGAAGEDLVEKQNAEQGLMPISPNEPALYGYAAENRHFARAFARGAKPELTVEDGVEVMRILMKAYSVSHTPPSRAPAR